MTTSAWWARNNWMALSVGRELMMKVNQLIGPGPFVLPASKRLARTRRTATTTMIASRWSRPAPLAAGFRA